MLAVVVIGWLFGFVGSMPLAGPIAVIVFITVLEGRGRRALYVGLGCALAEAGYAALAFWGFSTLLAEHPIVLPVSRAVAAVILIALGVVFVRRQSEPTRERPDEGRRRGAFVLGFSITALNPTLIGTWAGATAVLFSTDLVPLQPAYSMLWGFSAGAGIASWYLVLIKLVERFRSRFHIQTLDKAVRVMGLVLIGFGVWFAWLFGDWVIGKTT